MSSHSAKVGRGLFLLKTDLDSFVRQAFENYHQGQTLTALEQIVGPVRDRQQPFVNLKTRDLLVLLQVGWERIYNRALADVEPNLIDQVITLHESWSGRQPFTGDEASQGLAAIQQLLAAMSSTNVGEVATLQRQCLEAPPRRRPRRAPSRRRTTTTPEAAPVADTAVKPTSMESAAPVVVAEAPQLVDAAPPLEPAAVADNVVEPAAAPLAPPETISEPAPAPVLSTATDPTLDELVAELRNSGTLSGADRVEQATQEGVAAAPADDSLLQQCTPALAQALPDGSRAQFYTNQAEALAQSLAGANVVLEAPAGSGETLAYAAPLAETLLRHPGSHGLLLCPTGTAANRGLADLTALLAPVGLTAQVLDGESDEAALPGVPANLPSVVITTPEALHQSLLAGASGWPQLLSNLKFIAIEQAQNYRDYFGGHMAALLRRLAHRLACLSASPRYFLTASACANPRQYAENLTGQGFTAITADSAPAPRRHYLLAQPAEDISGSWAGLAQRLAAAALACRQLGKSALVMCPGQELAEGGWEQARQLATEKGLDTAGIDLLSGETTTCSSGPAAAESAASPRVAFAPNQPDGDIDLGRWDGLILAGDMESFGPALQRLRWPGGYGDQAAFALLLATDAAGQPDGKSLANLLAGHREQISVSSNDAEIIRAHLPYLVREMEGRIYSFSADILGETMFQLLCQEAAALETGAELPQPDLDLRGLAAS